jgi:hypothetical protein
MQHKVLELVSDLCRCGRFRRDHRGSCPCVEFVFHRRCTTEDIDRWVSAWYGTARPTFQSARLLAKRKGH